MRVAIVGAGFGGLGLGIKLKQAGVEDFTILERGDGVGGVWRHNDYPGLACDVPSHLYSFSFEPNHRWSRRFPPRDEIVDYLEGCVSKYGLAEHLRLGTEVESAAFDPDRGWRVELKGEEPLDVDVLVAATGQLSRPATPRIEGLEDFEGDVFHSAAWDHGCELSGRRVAVVGTGASAIQIIPPVARDAAHLTVFQRSAPWVVPKPDRPYAAWQQRLFHAAPWLQGLSRLWIYLIFESRVLGFTRHRWIMRAYERAYRRRLRREVPDPALRSALTPDYPIGCKRVLLSSDYVETLKRPEVSLVTDRIEHAVPGGIVTEGGDEHELDAIVLATGFATNDFLAPMRIAGLDGRDLDSAWAGGAEAYLGMNVAGFPNLFILYGPNTNLGAGSIIHMLESQINYVMESLRALEGLGASYMDVRPEVQRAFNDELQRRLEGSVWNAGCTNWYVDEAGRNTNNWPGLTLEYRRRTRRPELSHYRVRLAG
jgi:cation diffusion facilitator CzcD-associated flavoprotein CzcO